MQMPQVTRRLRSTATLALILFALALVVGTIGTAPTGATVVQSDDNRENATTITPGTTVDETISSPDDPEDWYKFQAQQGQTINVTATMGPDGSNDIILISPTGRSTSARGSGETVVTGMTARQTGTYYIRVRPNVQPGGDYSFEVRTYSTDEAEPNEDRQHAADIAVGSTVQGTVSIGDEDWYTFRAQRGETLTLTATMGPDGSNDIFIIGPNGNSATVRGSGETVVTGMTARVTGTYFIEVRPNAFPGADYSVEVKSRTTTEREPNEDRGNATRLTLNVTVQDTISIGDVDWYAFDLQHGRSITVTGAIGADGTNTLVLQSREGEHLASARGSGRNVTISATAGYDGTHYLLVRQESYPGANYTIEVRTNGTGTIHTPTATAGEDSSDTPGGENETNGLPVVPIGFLFVLVLFVLLFLLWRRREQDDEDSSRTPE